MDTGLTPLAYNMVMVLINHSLMKEGVKLAAHLHAKYVAKVEAARLETSPNQFSFAEIEADSFFTFLKESELLSAYVADVKEAFNAHL